MSTKPKRATDELRGKPKRPGTIAREIVEEYFYRRMETVPELGIDERWLTRRIAAEIRRARRGEP